MKSVSSEELMNYKILPFNIYTEFGEKIFAAGEVLTPGKILQLKHMDALYRDDTVQYPEHLPENQNQPENILQEEIDVLAEKVEEKVNNFQEFTESLSSNITIEKFDMNPAKMVKNDASIDDINILNYKGPINKSSLIEPQNQLKLKAFYNQIMLNFENRPIADSLSLFVNVRDKIIQDIILHTEDVHFSSQLKLIGEYKKCHDLNVAILSGVLAKKLDLNDTFIADVILAALLHDIGKTKVSDQITEKVNPTGHEQRLLENHTKLGYKILKEDMGLPENISNVALEHHECNDGSGYPFGKSGDSIGLESQIVSVCNYYDNLTFNRTPLLIKNSKDAVRMMLEIGTKKFYASVLYTFVHMFNYNDTINFEDMIL